MKYLFILLSLIFCSNVFAQKEYLSPNGLYKFSAPDAFVLQQTANQRNEFILINNEQKSSLLVKVNTTIMTDESIKKFKLAADSVIEKNVFSFVSHPKIIKRGEVERFKNNSIYFHVEHHVQMPGENKYMINYLFYHKDKEINFIFRTDKEQLQAIIPAIESIVSSIQLL